MVVVGWGGIGRRIELEQGDAGVEGDALLAFVGGGMEKAVATDGAQAARGDVAQVAGEELLGGEAEGALSVAAGAVGPGEGDRVLVEAGDTGIADGGAADVGSEVADDVGAVAEGADVDAPVLLPNGMIVTGGGRQVAAELSDEVAKAGAQDRLGDQECGAFDGADAPLGGLAGAGNDGVDMGMEVQLLVPGMQHHSEAAVAGTQPAWVGEDLPQGL